MPRVVFMLLGLLMLLFIKGTWLICLIALVYGLINVGLVFAIGLAVITWAACKLALMGLCAIALMLGIRPTSGRVV